LKNIKKRNEGLLKIFLSFVFIGITVMILLLLLLLNDWNIMYFSDYYKPTKTNPSCKPSQTIVLTVPSRCGDGFVV